MSGIFGVYRYDGLPLAIDWLGRMRSAMAFYGCHGGEVKTADSLALGHLLLRIVPEDTYERQPISCRRGLVVSAARLDNRDELLEFLEINQREAGRISDGHIIGMAFDSWGEAVCERLQGDWSIAAWDREKRKLMLARDAHGSENLYVHEGPGFIAFASSIKALLALPKLTREPDLFRLAQVLLGWQGDGDLTAYSHLRRLLWAQKLTLGSDGISDITHYWSPEGRDLLTYKRDDEYEEAFLHLYSRAVRHSLRSAGQVATMLSGGRDSGSVTAIAAPFLAREGRSYTTYTSVPTLPPDGAGKTRIGDEWEQAHSIALMAGPNVNHIPVDAESYSVLEGIEHFIDVHDGPSHAAGNHYWLRAIVETAAHDGMNVLLTGQMGNGTVSWAGNGSALWALLNRQPALAWRLFLHAESNLRQTVKRQILKPALTPMLRCVRRFKLLRREGVDTLSALNAKMLSLLRLDARLRESKYDPTFTPSPLRDQRRIFFTAPWCVGAGIWSELGAAHAISIRDPTSNLALVEFLLRVPDCQFRRHGQVSYLLKRALRTKLPPPVLEGRRKGLQAADVGHRLLKELPRVQHKLDTFEAHPTARELLNVPLMRACLHKLAARVDPESTANANAILLRGLGVGMFLLRRF